MTARDGNREYGAGEDVALNGARLVLRPDGALWWPSERLLAVADLHLEKGSAYGVRGQFLPPYDSRATIARLEIAVRDLRPAAVVALGDSFHDAKGPSRLCAEDRAALSRLCAAVRMIWIAGNHDEDAAAACGGEAWDELRQGPLVFRHEPAPAPALGEICGHLHPKAAVLLKGRRISRPCFAADGSRMVLPAFGAFTGGLDVWDPAFFPVFPRSFTAYLLGKGRVYAFDKARLHGRAAA